MRLESHPTRGAWIETPFYLLDGARCQCRTPPGVRGLKHKIFTRFKDMFKSRTPPGVRGLKPYVCRSDVQKFLVAPHPGCVD